MFSLRTTILIAASSVLIAACEPSVEEETMAEAPPVVVEAAPVLKAQFVYDLRTGTLLRKAPDSPLELQRLADGALTISGSVPGASPGGKTQGAFLTIDGDTERALSGKKISVRVLARSTNGSSATAKFAYSTAEVGNSGWKQFELTNDYSEYAFEYDVPQLNKGLGDYIGVLPVAGSIELLSIGIDIL